MLLTLASASLTCSTLMFISVPGSRGLGVVLFPKWKKAAPRPRSGQFGNV